MQAIAVNSDQQFVELELATPRPGPRDLLVRIEAVAVNPHQATRHGTARSSTESAGLGRSGGGAGGG